MKKIEKKINAFTLVELLVVVAIVAVVAACVWGCFHDSCTLERIKKEQKNHTIAVLGALKETITVEFYSNKREYIDVKYSADGPYTIWSFHKLGDEYGQPPHTAKVVNGQVVEVNGKPVKEVIIEIPAEEPEKEKPKKKERDSNPDSLISNTVRL